MNTRKQTRMLVESGIMIALAYVLNLVELYKFPQGGSVTPGSMIPIFIIAYRWGVGPGLLAGSLFGVLQMFMGGYVVSPVQALLDYPLAFGVLGIAGLFAKRERLGLTPIISGVVISITLRFVCHLISGVVFFKDYAPEGMNPWYYSASYNFGYLGIEALITIAIVFVLARAIQSEMILKY